MAKEEQGVSLRVKDAIESGGLFGPGPAKMKRVRFEMFEYKPKAGSKKRTVRAPVMLIAYERDGEIEKQPYGVGSGWGIGKGGLSLIPRNGQEGLPNNCNAIYLLDSLEEAGMPSDYLETPDMLDGIEVILIKKPIERDFGDDGIRKGSVLVVSEVVSAPWMEEGKKGKKKTAKKDEDEDDESAEAEDEDEEEDEEEEKPAKGKGKSSAKKKSDDDDEETEAASSSTDIDDEAIEALIDVLSNGHGPVKQVNVEKLVREALKGNKQRHVIAARASEDDLLEQEKGWSYDAKKGTIALD